MDDQELELATVASEASEASEAIVAAPPSSSELQSPPHPIVETQSSELLLPPPPPPPPPLQPTTITPSDLTTNTTTNTNPTPESSSNLATTAPPPDAPAEEDEKEEIASHDEFTDEESEAHTGNKSNTPGRTVTLQMLLDAKILQPGEAAMTIEYLGQRFVGDLQADGKIKSHETETIFCSPSAWAIHCKRIINPDKKSGCGWASVKYKGKKLDSYKTAWFRKVQMQRDATPTDEIESEVEPQPAPPPLRVVIKHNTVPNRMTSHDANTMVEAVSFSSLGKVQPFLISIGTNACFVLDLHCHLTMSEVCGYLGGTWDINTHNLAVTHAFPCLTCKGDDKPTILVEAEIHLAMEKMGLTLVGWYHSHPVNAAMPTLRDCDSQLEYQIRKRGPSDLTYSPCIGIICSPYNPESPVLESSLTCYWVLPPPELRPTEYPRPCLMQYTVMHDSHLAPQAMEQISKSIKYYASTIDEKAIKFYSQYKHDITYLEKLKASLAAKFPREQSDGLLWNFIKDALGCSTEGDDKLDLDALLAVSQPIPSSKSQSTVIPNVPSVSALQQMISMPSSIPPLNIPTSAFGGLSNKYDLSTHLNIPMPQISSKSSKNSSSMSSLGLPPGLDVLTSMTLGLGSMGGVPLSLPSSNYDALTANSLLANLPPGISTSLAATLTGTKMPESSLAASYSNLLSGRPDKNSISSHSTSSASMSTSLASSMPSNLMLSSAEIANALFQGGKFPSTSSLLGLPDPMSQSILDANNMYLSPSLLKMQDTLNLLKPMSSSSPLMGKSSAEQSLYLKSTQDLMKSAKEYLPPDVNISAMKSAGKLDYSMPSEMSMGKQPDVSISKLPKLSDYASDFTLPSLKSGESFLNQMLELTKKAGKGDFPIESSHSPAKIPKLDSYSSSLNLSSSSALNLSSQPTATETQTTKTSKVNKDSSGTVGDEPQNLSFSSSNRETANNTPLSEHAV